MSSGSKRTIIAALVGNGAIAISKFVAAAVTGSSAMISEGIHSTVDTGNQALLLLGQRQARRPPDERHPFGHGKELYFWSLIVAIVIFGLGGGISIYEGIEHLVHPVATTDPVWNYSVLGVAALFEGYSWSVAWREFQRRRGDEGLWTEVKASKDPTVVTVLLEDSAALTGIVIAAAGIAIGHATGNTLWDGSASIAIGLLLATVAVMLARESKGLLVGESADPKTLSRIRRLAESDPAVIKLAKVLTMHLGPQDVLVNVDVQFRRDLSTDELAAAVQRLERRIRDEIPDVKRIFVEALSVSAGVASHAPESR